MAISEACQFEIRDEVNGMVEREEVSTKTEAFQKMVEFYAAIGLEIKEKTVRTKYYRAESVSNETTKETDVISDTNGQLEKLEKPTHGGARPGAGRKSNNPGVNLPTDDLPAPQNSDSADCGESAREKDSGPGKYIEPDSYNPWGKASFLLKLILFHLQNNCDLSGEIQDCDLTHLRLDFEALEPYRQKLWD